MPARSGPWENQKILYILETQKPFESTKYHPILVLLGIPSSVVFLMEKYPIERSLKCTSTLQGFHGFLFPKTETFSQEFKMILFLGSCSLHT